MKGIFGFAARWFVAVYREAVLAGALIGGWFVPVLAGALIGAGIGVLISRATPPEYSATAQLYLTPASSSSLLFQDVTLGQNLARNYVPLVTADGVLRAAMDQLQRSDDLDRFKSRTQVAQVKDTSIITVSFRDQDPNRAAGAANAIVQAFTDQSRALQATLQDAAASRLVEQSRAVEADIRSLDAQIATLRAAPAASAAPGQATSPVDQQARLLTLEGLRQSKQQTLAQLVRTGDDIRLNAARSQNTVNVWQEALPPRRPDSPNTVLNTTLGAIGGALLAVVAVWALQRRADRFTTMEAAVERLGVPVIAEIGRRQRPNSLDVKLVVRDDPRSVAAEGFRALRTNVLLAHVHHRPRTILVTSAVPFEGKSFVSANLALALAEVGTPTILVDAHVRGSSQQGIFGLRTQPGLMNLLTDDLRGLVLEQWRVLPNLVVIPSGVPPASPATPLASARMSTLVEELRRGNSETTVIIDASPLLSDTDATALATTVDSCIVVIDASRTPVRVARRAIEVLRSVHAPILGVVLNKVSADETAMSYGHSYSPDRKEASDREASDRKEVAVAAR